MTPLQKAISILGSKSNLAKQFNILPWNITKWERTQVPAERCPDIERLTYGKVTCEELRPDVNWEVLRKPKRNVSKKQRNDTQ